jgi:predicted amidohydrolase YtcJ
MDHDGQEAEAMAVSGREVLAVGSDAEITACAGERTRVLDLGGKTILPGLIDVHTHAIDWAKAILRDEIDANFPKVRTVADIVEEVSQRAEAAEPGEWIVGYGWDDAKLEERRYVTKLDLDPVSPENPVYLVHVSGHLSLANSVALSHRRYPGPRGGPDRARRHRGTHRHPEGHGDANGGPPAAG